MLRAKGAALVRKSRAVEGCGGAEGCAAAAPAPEAAAVPTAARACLNAHAEDGSEVEPTPSTAMDARGEERRGENEVR